MRRRRYDPDEPRSYELRGEEVVWSDLLNEPDQRDPWAAVPRRLEMETDERYGRMHLFRPAAEPDDP
jgi:hypothetical protein